MVNTIADLRRRLLDAVARRDEKGVVVLYARAMERYRSPGSGRLSDDADFWREVNAAIEATWGGAGLERIKGAAATTKERVVRSAGGQRLPRWASAKKLTRYTVALDDSGQKAVRPSEVRRCFFLGGIVVPTDHLEQLRHTWTAARGGEDVKARTYISSLGFEEHLNWAEALLSVEMVHWNALPVWTSFDKGEVGHGMTLATRKGGRRIDVSRGFEILACSIASHLERVKGRADSVIVDHMSSEQEEAALQEKWHETRKSLGGPKQRALPQRLTFVDSATSPEVQIADVLMGVLRSAQEARRPIAPGLVALLKEAQSKRLVGFHLS